MLILFLAALSYANNQVTVYFRDEEHPEETREEIRAHLARWLYNKNHDYKDVTINEPRKGLVNDF